MVGDLHFFFQQGGALHQLVGLLHLGLQLLQPVGGQVVAGHGSGKAAQQREQPGDDGYDNCVTNVLSRPPISGETHYS